MPITSVLDGPRLAPASRRAPRALVVLLHGYGSDGADMISLAPHWQRALPDAAFVAPNAPEPCPGSGFGRQWWPLASFDRAALAAGARAAAPALDAFLDHELDGHGLTDDALLLVGFSQGTMMALHVGLRRNRSPAGIIGYSGGIVDADRLAGELGSRPPVLLVHGDADTVVPMSAMHEAHAKLSALGLAVERHLSPGLGHGVDPAGLDIGAAFARRVLGSARAAGNGQ